MSSISDVLNLLQSRGHSEYGGEAVTQLQHALQSATLAEQSGASPALIVAALLHDIGHLLHELPDDAPDQGVDDQHEAAGHRFLRSLFPDAVCEPVRLHVTAKRYLCAVDPEYAAQLSEPSRISLKLQGGPMTEAEVERFRQQPFAEHAVKLRKWDDEAKVPGQTTPPLSHFAEVLHFAAGASAVADWISSDAKGGQSTPGEHLHDKDAER